MIPYDEWPDWAVRHCWDEDGDGRFFGAALNDDGNGWWDCVDQPSGIPLPPGHDWRVPVMRPDMVNPMSVDLEQFRDLIGFACLHAINLPETDPRRDFIRQCGDLLFLIDGQKGVE